jgi:tetratricopeptide (TPR) repeat protein
MKKIIFVVFCLLFSISCFANTMSSRLQQIEADWEQIETTSTVALKKSTFPRLLDEASSLAKEYPLHAEPIILQACIILTQARIQGPFDALSSVYKARDLLIKAMTINPLASEGSAIVTMGVLYYKVPGWPIAFGDTKKAEKMLSRALSIKPKGIDTNYFYGEFLMLQDKPDLAIKYLKNAIDAPLLPGITRTTLELRSKAKLALKDIQRLTDSKSQASLPTLQSAMMNANYHIK